MLEYCCCDAEPARTTPEYPGCPTGGHGDKGVLSRCKEGPKRALLVVKGRIYVYYLDLGPHVPSGTLGDELSPSGTVTGNTSILIMSATATDTHLSHILCVCIRPCPLWPAPSSPSSLWSPVYQSSPVYTCIRLCKCRLKAIRKVPIQLTLWTVTTKRRSLFRRLEGWRLKRSPEYWGPIVVVRGGGGSSRLAPALVIGSYVDVTTVQPLDRRRQRLTCSCHRHSLSPSSFLLSSLTLRRLADFAVCVVIALCQTVNAMSGISVIHD